MRKYRLGLVPLAALMAGGLGAWAMEKTAGIVTDDPASIAAMLAPTTDFSKAEPFEALQAGATTSIEEPDRSAFSHFSANLAHDRRMDFRLGNALFRKLWVAAPSSTQASDGLGPFYNARSCEQCHRDDGRGIPPDGKDRGTLFLRLARAAETDAERAAVADGIARNFPDPVYGGQLQDRAIPGLDAEGQMEIGYSPLPFALPDGSVVTLRKPHYAVTALRYGPLDAATTLSPRIAPPMIGLGLIEAIPEDRIRALADPDDADRDGISGRLQVVRDLDGNERIGRFGWKAENASIRDQAALAFAFDLGLSTPVVDRPWGDCMPAQTDCAARPTGEQVRLGRSEAPDPVLALVTFYSQHLAVPARRRSGFPEVLEGKALFYASGCTGCHRPKFLTAADAPSREFRSQLIWPYSDFLLHDMGDGLADGQAVGGATGREWRTPPLWGIGLADTVAKKSFYLHDGRARTLEEAILWHGGEAEAARDSYARLSRNDREKLIRFLESL
ncbi:MAG: c-type cytochrome [Rhizobiaceae bacterium]|nr:c-type cytochrome [Rhizobiaceae bacterium]